MDQSNNKNFPHLEKRIEADGLTKKISGQDNSKKEYLSLEETRGVSASEVIGENRKRGVTVAQKNAGPENQIIN